MSELYEDDIVLRSERQAEFLRRRASGRLASDADLDWLNIIEEIEGVGSERLHAVESLLLRALLHMLQAEAWPQSPSVPHWQSEAKLFRAQARRRFVPSMSQRIDIGGLYRDAFRALPSTVDCLPPLPVDSSRQPTLDELLSDTL